jgi:hypothetical protein
LGVFRETTVRDFATAIQSVRIALLRLMGAKIGRDCLIEPRVRILMPWNIELGDHVAIGREVEFLNFAPVRIASMSVVSQHTYLLHRHARLHASALSAHVLDDRDWQRVLGRGGRVHRTGRYDWRWCGDRRALGRDEEYAGVDGLRGQSVPSDQAARNQTAEHDVKVPVSILIPIKNEAPNLARCLSSVAWADEIFVVDSQSTDGSQRIAEQHGATVVQFHFTGTWPKKKNWALENLPFKREWVFILDADEVLPPEAEAEIRAIVTDEFPDSASAPAPRSADLQSAVSPIFNWQGDIVSNGHWSAATCRRFPAAGLVPLRQATSRPARKRRRVAALQIQRRWVTGSIVALCSWAAGCNTRIIRIGTCACSNTDLAVTKKLTDVNTASGDNEVHEHVVCKAQPTI